MLLDPRADLDEFKNLANDPRCQGVQAELLSLIQKYGAGPNLRLAASLRD